MAPLCKQKYNVKTNNKSLGQIPPKFSRLQRKIGSNELEAQIQYFKQIWHRSIAATVPNLSIPEVTSSSSLPVRPEVTSSARNVQRLFATKITFFANFVAAGYSRARLAKMMIVT